MCIRDRYYGYTFRKRFGWPAPAAWAAAGVLSLAVPAVVRSFGAIPVYRSLKETRDMMEQSAQALLHGESIMLCPDVAYDSAAPATGEIYKGFLQLEKLYHAGTGAHPVSYTHLDVYKRQPSGWRTMRKAPRKRPT